MAQDVIVLIIISLVAGYSLFAVVKSFRAKNASSCGGCTGCELKQACKTAAVSPVQNSSTRGQAAELSRRQTV